MCLLIELWLGNLTGGVENAGVETSGSERLIMESGDWHMCARSIAQTPLWSILCYGNTTSLPQQADSTNYCRHVANLWVIMWVIMQTRAFLRASASFEPFCVNIGWGLQSRDRKKSQKVMRGSHRKDTSPLTQCLNYSSACDKLWLTDYNNNVRHKSSSISKTLDWRRVVLLPLVLVEVPPIGRNVLHCSLRYGFVLRSVSELNCHVIRNFYWQSVSRDDDDKARILLELLFVRLGNFRLPNFDVHSLIVGLCTE